MSEAIQFDADSTRKEVDPDVLAAMLRPYRPECRYLRRAFITAFDPLTAEGELGIPSSCYIESTGHFNAVEFNICFNQLAYTLVAQVVKSELVPEWRGYGYDRFKARQLGDMFIVKMQNTFDRQIDPRAFRAELRVNRIITRSKVIFVDSAVAFSDGSGGSAHGEVRLCCVK